tara:strand:+ start:69 stop:503 length:435 start_codon:yes stop_codon:yes gene_type:complete
MKSGFDNLESKDESLENAASVVMVYMENALKSADIYVKHSKRSQITPEDIKRGLMLEVFFMKSRPNLMEQCETMKEKIQEIIKEDETYIIENDDDEKEDEEFKESECKCAMCGCFNTIYTRWDKFTPELPMEKIMVKHIDSISV